MNNIVQTLRNTIVDAPIDDVDAWVDRLSNLATDHDAIRDSSDPRVLTEREAEVIVRYYGTDQSRSEIAECMGISPSQVDNHRYSAEDNLIAFEATLQIIGELRDQIRPDPNDNPR